MKEDIKALAVEHARVAVKNLARVQYKEDPDELPIQKQRREQQAKMLRIWEFLAMAAEKA